jgi:phosphoglycolate phosphatase-like HAD superfamily hydrolase
VFDFDGTLVDSNDIKRRGFDHAFAEYPDKLDEIRAYCYGSNHTVRGEKFRHVTEKILNLEYTDELDAHFHKRYAEFTTASVAAAPEIPGAAAFVKRLGPLHPALLSSTPTAILMDILERRGWTDLFFIVQGAPVNKAAWLRGLLAVERCEPRQLLFFGDTDEDGRAAADAGCTFVRVGAVNEGLNVRDFSAF